MSDSEEVDTLQKFGSAFQSKAIRAMLDDRDFLERIHDIVLVEYWESEGHQWIVEETLDYFAKYRKAPTLDVFKISLGDVKVEVLNATIVDQLRNIFVKITTDDMEFVKDEFLTFCKNQKLKNAIVQSVDLLKSGRYDAIKTVVDDAMKAGMERDIGHEYLKELEIRVTYVARDTVATGWPTIDDLTMGGLGPGELGVIISSAGGGKSWCLSHLGKEAMLAGKNVLHITLELNENYVGLRYDSCFSGIPFQSIQDNVEKVAGILETIPGQLIIKYFPTKSVGVTSIMAHTNLVKNMGFPVDIVILDYADILSTPFMGQNSNTYTEQGSIYEDLRGMAGELDVPIWTASQASRSSLGDDIIEAEKVADSYRKIMTADFVLSLSRKAADKTNNTGRFHVIKNRFGPDGITFPSRIDTSTGLIELYDETTTGGMEVMVEMNKNGDTVRSLLKKKYDQTQNLELDEKETEDIG